VAGLLEQPKQARGKELGLLSTSTKDLTGRSLA
jgi:hypothetical protein